MTNKKTVGGELILQKIPFDTVYKKKVHRHAPNQGRICLPERLIGTEVYIIEVKE